LTIKKKNGHGGDTTPKSPNHQATDTTSKYSGCQFRRQIDSTSEVGTPLAQVPVFPFCCM